MIQSKIKILMTLGLTLASLAASAQEKSETVATTEVICTGSITAGIKRQEVEVLVQRIFPGNSRIMTVAVDGKIEKKGAVTLVRPGQFDAATDASYKGESLSLGTTSAQFSHESAKIVLTVDGQNVLNSMSCVRFAMFK